MTERAPAAERNPLHEALVEIEQSEYWLGPQMPPDPGTIAQGQAHATLALAWVGIATWTQQQVVLDQAARMGCPHPPDKRDVQTYIEAGRARKRVVCSQCQQDITP